MTRSETEPFTNSLEPFTNTEGEAKVANAPATPPPMRYIAGSTTQEISAIAWAR